MSEIWLRGNTRQTCTVQLGYRHGMEDPIHPSNRVHLVAEECRAVLYLWSYTMVLFTYLLYSPCGCGTVCLNAFRVMTAKHD